MRATELMIGDLIQYNGEILRLYEFSRKYGYFGDGHPLNGILISEIEPIPLTQEILEKNGFNYVKETGYMCYEQVGDRQYNLIAVKGNILQMQFTSGNLEWTECRYVHTFQHALKLCGIEKEIEL